MPAADGRTGGAIRSQLSLFVPPNIGIDLEAIRRVVDPVQHGLIPAHVTLCREDELTGLGLEECAVLFAQVQHDPVTLRFGPPERFAEHGILPPCIGGTAGFQSLREVILGAGRARPHAPHLTLAHPRNPKAPGNDLHSAVTLRDGLSVTFDEVHLIEQEGGAPWIVRGTFRLRSRTA
jgi:hypothetical protein